MNIERKDLLEKLLEFSLQGNGVVTGAPGAGKTHSIKALVNRLKEKGVPYLFIGIDQLGDASEQELRERLGYKGTFVQALKDYNAKQQKLGVLILDGFDAARSEEKRERILWYVRNVISELKGLWNVVVSVRMYDARKSQELLSLFDDFKESDLSPYRSPERILCRHFFIPQLENSEIKEVFPQIPNLEKLYQNGSVSFKDLLRLPFNLWLIEGLLSQNINLSEFSNIRSETQLLGLFWDYRVNKTNDKESRRFLLSKITKDMVNKKSLSARKDIVYEASLEKTWESLLSDEIIDDKTYLEQRVTFTHNILFDYAVSVLLIEDNSQQLVQFITEDPSRPLFLRPSLTYYFTRIWYADLKLFWELFWYVLPSDNVYLKLFSRLIPPIVVINETSSIEQLDSVIKKHFGKEKYASMGILRLIQALKSADSSKDDLWSLFFNKISQAPKVEFAWELATTTHAILEKSLREHKLTIVNECASTARNLLTWAWGGGSQENAGFVEQLASIWLVPMVAKTYSSNTVESKQLLQKALALINKENFNINYIYKLVDSVEYIWSTDPVFVSEIYLTVFGYEEKSKATTHMGGIVLSLTSNRRQDYEMCYYSLTKKYPKFLRHSPSVAVEAVLKVLNNFIIENEVIPYLREGSSLEKLYKTFQFDGVTCSYLQDLSHIWNEGGRTEEPIEMGIEFFKYLEKLLSENNKKEVDSLIDIVKKHARVAFIWSKLIETGSKFPDILANRLFDLCISNPILTGSDTSYEIGEFLRVAAPYFSIEKRQLIEKTIIALPNAEEEANRKEAFERFRDRLLGCIPKDYLVLKESVEILNKLEKEGIPQNRPFVKFTSSSSAFTEDDWLIEQGVAPNKEENQGIKKYFLELDKFSSDWSNKIPTVEAIKAIFPSLKALRAELNNTEGIDEPILEMAWSKLGTSIITVLRDTEIVPEDVFIFSRQIVLECSLNPSPKPNPKYDEEYNYASWSSHPRTEAAQGIGRIAYKKVDPDILKTVHSLAFDKVPSVRYLTVRELFFLVKNAENYFWDLMTLLVEKEKNQVVREALCFTLDRVLFHNEEKALNILKALVSDLEILKEKSKVSERIVHLLLRFVLVKENQWAITVLEKTIASPVQYAPVLSEATRRVVGLIKPDKVISNDPKEQEIVSRSMMWLERFITASAHGIKEVRKLSKEDSSEGLKEKLRNLYEPIDNIVMRFYFATDVNKQIRNDDSKAISDEERKVFYFRIKPLLEKILEFSSEEDFGVLLASTAHHLMEILNGVLKYDPKGALHLAAVVAKASKPYQYNLDSMAIKEVVNLVESILADYRNDVKEGAALDDLLTLLDIFAEVGWVEALRLVWRLDEIFR